MWLGLAILFITFCLDMAIYYAAKSYGVRITNHL